MVVELFDGMLCYLLFVVVLLMFWLLVLMVLNELEMSLYFDLLLVFGCLIV